MNVGALSLGQTPPLRVPMPFLISAPVFLLAGALVLLFGQAELFATRWTREMLALTHLLTLGFLGTIMLGALQQLLPVLAGAPVPAAARVSVALYGLWIPGTVLLVAGMGLGGPWALQAGAVLLAAAVALFVVACGSALWRSGSRHDTIPAMALALLALAVSATFAVWLLWRTGWQAPVAHPVTRLHIGWAAILWIAGLIMGVAYQVVPMFQLTSPYPRGLRRTLVPLLAALLVAWSLWPSPWLSAALAVVLSVFAGMTLWLQHRRRRRISDPTLDFWRVAMVSMLLAALAWMIWLVRPDPRLEVLIGALFLAGFATAAVNGMLYKIVPFLVWLHLTNRNQEAGLGQRGLPNMKQVIPQRHARIQWWLYTTALALLCLSVLFALPPWPAGLAWTASTLYLLWNLIGALRCYRRHLRPLGSEKAV
ncbi:hypothetical protein B1C78_02280 [Thioalkalivibrio denitrificans]|uniref:Uncharacterized protein n=1 Tax=Thioalkalivibrio denitrificans TaxID=108003 RepID=A0A1V3NSQ5_9GAMM|nr:hypothetical protein [Thioalkalivibrio denitrificans]OOG28071.1 hypothetical protein B1C78_02280 [Thioalkalivibrio denitrificans]